MKFEVKIKFELYLLLKIQSKQQEIFSEITFEYIQNAGLFSEK